MWIQFINFFKTDLTIIVNMRSFNGLFNGKWSSVSNLIFIKYLTHLNVLPPFIVSILFLISFQSSVYFLNTSLFSFVESKAKYVLPFFPQDTHLLQQWSGATDLHCKYFHNRQFFWLLYIYCCKGQCFYTTFCLF